MSKVSMIDNLPTDVQAFVRKQFELYGPYSSLEFKRAEDGVEFTKTSSKQSSVKGDMYLSGTSVTGQKIVLKNGKMQVDHDVYVLKFSPVADNVNVKNSFSGTSITANSVDDALLMLRQRLQ